MRLFIYNNGQLKYFFKQPYLNTYNNLNDVFGQQITDEFDLTNDPRKKVLWAQAFKTMTAVTFAGSKTDFVWENANERSIGVQNGTDGYDFYLDRGTGWCAMSKNYSVYREINNKGNIPEKGDYLTEDKTPPWQDFTSKFWGITTNGSTTFVQNLISGEKTIIPFGTGNFYGEDVSMSKDDFEDMVRVSAITSSTVRAIVEVEWPAVAFDRTFFNQLSTNQIPAAQQKTAKLQYEAFIKNGNLRDSAPVTNLLPVTPRLGAAQYLQKLQQVENYLVITYRQMRMLTTSYHFDSGKLDMTWYQKLYSGILYTLGATCKLIAFIVGGASASGVAALPVTAGKANYAIGAPGKELFTLFSSYFDKKHALYNMGGQPQGVNTAIENMLDILMISYAAFELFLLKWGLAQLVTTRTPEQIEKKLDKVKALMIAKNNHEGLPVTNRLKEEVEAFIG
jgi:hypothetical protein